MNSSDIDRERLEWLIGRALAGQPAQRAPATLEDRVWAEVARQATLPWWRRGFGAWPMAARIALILVLLAVLWLLHALTGASAEGAGSALRSGVGDLAGGWPATLRVLVEVIRELGGMVARAVPSAWAYGFAAAIAALYVTCFGLGAATYRLLQVRG
jgi:hypothetical protein